LLRRGLEFQPVTRADLEPRLVESLVRMARLAEAVAETLRDHPDPAVRRSAAILAARAHPVRAGLHA
jgi:DNA-binding MurR/RpiR family transcriptional regulator